jgi:hypothetical protein
MSGEYLTEQEDAFLSPPIALQPDETPCDCFGCDKCASVLVVGAALCAEHFDGYLIEDGPDLTYYIPVTDLVGGADWREARRRMYVERAAAFPRLVRNAQRERLLDLLAARRVDELLHDA